MSNDDYSDQAMADGYRGQAAMLDARSSHVPPVVLTNERHQRLWRYFTILKEHGHKDIAEHITQILYAPIVKWEDR